MFSQRKIWGILTFLLLAVLPLNAQELSVQYQDTKLSAVLSDIQNRTGYHFVYNNSLVNVSVPVTVEASGSLRQVLDAVMGQAKVEYKIIDRQIILTPAKQAPKTPQKVTVSGIVTDETGAPLPGVFVSENTGAIKVFPVSLSEGGPGTISRGFCSWCPCFWDTGNTSAGE